MSVVCGLSCLNLLLMFCPAGRSRNASLSIRKLPDERHCVREEKIAKFHPGKVCFLERYGRSNMICSERQRYCVISLARVVTHETIQSRV